MPEVELGTRVVRSKDLIVIHYYSAYLEALIVRSALVMINDQGEIWLSLNR